MSKHYFNDLGRVAILVLAGLAPLAMAGGLDPFDTVSALGEPTVCPKAADAAPLSLADAVGVALCANPQTREVWANARAQAATLGTAEAAWLPSLGATAGVGVTRSGGVAYDQKTLGASLSWLVFDFGGRSASIESARQLLGAANATRDSTVQSVFLSAVQAWYQVHGQRTALEAARESEKSAELSFKAAAARHQAGAATAADELQAKTAWSQAQLNRIQTEGNLRTAEGNLANVLGRDAHRPVAITPLPAIDPPARFEEDLDRLVEAARSRRPDLKAAEAQVASARAGVDVARAGGLPSLSLAASANRSRLDEGPSANTGTVGLTLTVPLFTGFSTNYKIRTAEAQAEAKESARDRIALQVAQDVWNAWQSLQTSIQSVRTTGDLISSAEAAEKVARGRYEAGVGSIIDLLSAQSALASARQQRVQALYGWNIARATLAQAVGALDTPFLDSLNESTGK